MTSRRSITVTVLFFVTTVLGNQNKLAAQDPPSSPNANVLWHVTSGFEQNDPHNPLSVNGQVVVGTDRGEVHSYDCATGEIHWIYNHGKRIFHRPASDGELVYFTSEQGIFALTVEDGSEVWAVLQEHCNGPIVSTGEHGLILVGGSDGILYAFDADDGDRVWTSEFISDAPDEPPGFSGERARMSDAKARPSALTIHEDTIYLSIFDQCRIVAVNVTDGSRRWSFQSKGWVFGSAVATSDHVYFGSQDRRFYCLNRNDGKEVWNLETKGRIESGGAVDRDSVYFGSCDGNLYCVNQTTGEVRWKFPADKWNGRRTPIYSVPILHNGQAVFAAGEGHAYAIDKQTGRVTWKIRPAAEAEIFSSPARHKGSYFFVTRASLEGKGQPSLFAIGQD